MGKHASRKTTNNKNVHRLDRQVGSGAGSRQRQNQPSHRYQKNIAAKSHGQAHLINALDDEGLTVAVGPAGTGKTYLAVAKAVEALESERVDRIILCRPAIDAGEHLGFLPGNIEAKLAPYLRPIYDVLCERMGGKKVKALMAEEVIEIAPIAYLRGRTFNNAFVVVDEAQNCTYTQLKMLVTRYGWNTTMVLAGDPDQSDLLPGISGLTELVERLNGVDHISVVNFAERDVIRHPLVASMLSAL